MHGWNLQGLPSWYVKLNDGSRYRIPLNVIMRGLRNNVFVIRVPQDEVDYVAEELIRRGFKPTILAVNKARGIAWP